MIPKLEETIYLDFVTSSATGAATDADSTPTAAVYEDATDTAILAPTVTKRTSLTGNYRVPVACTAANGFEAGKSYNVIASATIGGIVAKALIGSFQVRTRSIDDASTYAGGDTSGTTTLLSRLSSTRAGYLDNLANTPPTAAEIKTALEASGSSLDTLLARLTTSRAIYLDKLNITGNVASQTDVLNVSNNTRLRSTIPQVLERPDSGSETVPLVIEFYDESGNMEAPDSTPTVTVTAQDGTDLSARVGSLSNPSTGRYTFNYTNAAAHAIEFLRWTVTIIEGGATRTYSYPTQLVDTSAVDFTASDRSTLADIVNYVDSLETRLTSVRAALLDKLDIVGNVANQATLDAVATDASSARDAAQLAQSYTENLPALIQDSDKFTATALSLAPSGGSGGSTAEEIAGAVWDETRGAAVVTKTALIGSGSVTVVSPTSSTGEEITLVRGDDYKSADDRALTFTSDSWPDLSGAGIMLKVGNGHGGVLFEVECSAVDASHVTAEISTTETVLMDERKHKTLPFDLEASVGGNIVTLVRGTVNVLNDVR